RVGWGERLVASSGLTADDEGVPSPEHDQGDGCGDGEGDDGEEAGEFMRIAAPGAAFAQQRPQLERVHRTFSCEICPPEVAAVAAAGPRSPGTMRPSRM